MDTNFTYTNNNSPNFAGMLTTLYDRVAERRKAKEENDKHAKATQDAAEAAQKSTATPVHREYVGVDSKKRSPLSEDWQMVGQPKQFNRAPRVLRPGQPASSEYDAEKAKAVTPKSIRPGVSDGAQYPPKPKKPRAPRRPQNPVQQ